MTTRGRPRPWQVWWTQFDTDPAGSEQGRIRPAIIVNTRFYANHRPNMAVVVPLTTKDRGLPWQPRLSITPHGRPSVALVEQVRAISHQRLQGATEWTLTDEDVANVRFVLRRMIDVGT